MGKLKAVGIRPGHVVHLNNWINQTTVDYGENVDEICGYITTLDNWLESVRAGNVGIADELRTIFNNIL